MANGNDLANAMAGMSPQQGQQFANMAIGALQQQQQMENQQQYKQQRLDLMRDKEQRLAKQAKFDRAAKATALRMEKQMNQIKADLTEQRQKLTETEIKYKQEQFEELRNKASTLKSMNQEMAIPGTDGETIKAGAAVQAGIFGDLIEEGTTSIGMSFSDLPTNVQEFRYLTDELNLSEDEALRRAGLSGENLDRLIKIMGNIPMMSTEEAQKELKKLQNATEQGGSTGGGGEGGSTAAGPGVSQSEVNKWFEQEYGQ